MSRKLLLSAILFFPLGLMGSEIKSRLAAASGIATFSDIVIFDDRDFLQNSPETSISHRGMPICIEGNLAYRWNYFFTSLNLDFLSVSSSAANLSSQFRNARWTRFFVNSSIGLVSSKEASNVSLSKAELLLKDRFFRQYLQNIM